MRRGRMRRGNTGGGRSTDSGLRKDACADMDVDMWAWMWTWRVEMWIWVRRARAHQGVPQVVHERAVRHVRARHAHEHPYQ